MLLCSCIPLVLSWVLMGNGKEGEQIGAVDCLCSILKLNIQPWLQRNVFNTEEGTLSLPRLYFMDVMRTSRLANAQIILLTHNNIMSSACAKCLDSGVYKYFARPFSHHNHHFHRSAFCAAKTHFVLSFNSFNVCGTIRALKKENNFFPQEEFSPARILTFCCQPSEQDLIQWGYKISFS